jgi:Tol biopolymer transport system component
MNKKTVYIIIITASVLLISCLIGKLVINPVPSVVVQRGELPDIFPDYKEIIVPVNIAPLNFKINEKAKRYIVAFSNAEGDKIILRSKNSKISIPAGKWRKLLETSVNNYYKVETWSKNEENIWTKYKSYSNHVVEDKIDKYIAFRHINAGYILWEKMGIYQRNLENFHQSPILLNDRTERNCMNCHSFCGGDPGKMMLHLRRPPGGTLLYNNGEIKFINTGTKYTMSPGVYPSWHPNGNLIAFSVNIINQKFHAAGKFINSVRDVASDIVVYDIARNMITTCPELSTKSLENLPVWSHDGQYLYYISCSDYNKDAPDTTLKYDLLRIAYNAASDAWGKIDTLLTAKETGMSISFPELSPDGKYLIFCMSNYGYFTVYSSTSDLYLMNLDSRKVSKLPVNSDYVESYHSWSSNSKWFLFVSKRLDGLYSRVFFSYMDSTGRASKPFLLPQRDPDYYVTNVLNFNRPVFIKDKVRISADKLAKAAYSVKKDATFDPGVDIDALSGATWIEKEVTKKPAN